RPAAVSIRVRFLRPRQTASGWLDGAPHAIDVGPIALGTLPLSRETTFAVDSVRASVLVEAEAVDAFIKLRVTLENREPWRPEVAASGDAMLERSLVGAHVLLAADGGAFVSLLEPQPEASAHVSGCHNRYTWPVLVGDRSQRVLMLSSPIVLYD